MVYISQIKVSSEELNYSSIDDEYIIRQLARKLVSDIPLDQLKKLISFTKIDPSDTEPFDSNIPQLVDLYDEYHLQYIAKVDLK